MRLVLCSVACCLGCSLVVDPRRLDDPDGGTARDQAPPSEAGNDGPTTCNLTASGPITVLSDGQLVERLKITSTGGAAITVSGKKDVVIRDCEIHHSGGHGIAFANATNLRIERVVIVHDGAPAKGKNASILLDNINGDSSSGVVIRSARLIRGSSGVHLVAAAGAKLSMIEGHDFRGPEPHGHFVRFERSDGALLEDFSCENPKLTSWPDAIISVYRSSNVTVRRGLIDGCNAPSGVGVIFLQDSGTSKGGTCEDVDAVRMGNGCFSGYPGRDLVFRRTRCRDNICVDQGRGLPESGGLGWAGEPSGSSNLKILDSTYYNMCHTLVWSNTVFTSVQLKEFDFTLRSPQRLSFCWDAAKP